MLLFLWFFFFFCHITVLCCFEFTHVTVSPFHFLRWLLVWERERGSEFLTTVLGSRGYYLLYHNDLSISLKIQMCKCTTPHFYSWANTLKTYIRFFFSFSQLHLKMTEWKGFIFFLCLSITSALLESSFFMNIPKTYCADGWQYSGL